MIWGQLSSSRITSLSLRLWFKHNCRRPASVISSQCERLYKFCPYKKSLKHTIILNSATDDIKTPRCLQIYSLFWFSHLGTSSDFILRMYHFEMLPQFRNKRLKKRKVSKTHPLFLPGFNPHVLPWHSLFNWLHLRSTKNRSYRQ